MSVNAKIKLKQRGGNIGRRHSARFSFIRSPLLSLLALFSLSACGGPLPPPDPYNLAGAKENISQGNLWYERGCYQEAGHYYLNGLDAARLSDNVSLIIRAQNSLGTAALAAGDKDLAAEYLQQALNLASAHPDQPELEKVFGNLGALAFQLGRAKDAAGFWQKAAETAEAKGLSAAPYYCDLARLHQAEGRRDEFSAMTAQALASTSESDPFTRADALNLAGREAMGKGALEEAENYFNQALELDRKTENTIGLAQDTESLALLMTKLERYGEAALFMDRSFYLWLAVGRDAAADRLLAHLRDLSAKHGHPQTLDSYLQARRDPGPFRLARQCP